MSATQRALNWARPKMRRGLLAALRLLFSDRDEVLVAHQLEETRTTLPVLAGFHFFATLAVFRLAFDAVDARPLVAWTIVSFLVEGVLILGYFALDHISEQAGRAQYVLRCAPFVALGLCLVWGWAALAFVPAAEPHVAAYIDLMAFLTFSVGLLCLVRLPATALQFILMPVVVLVTRAMQAEATFDWYGLLLAAVALAAGISVMLALSYSFKRRALLERTLRHDAEVLMLLLADFGGEAKDWLWETDAKGVITYHSAKFAELLSLPGEDCRGENFIRDFVALTNPLLVSKMLVHEDLRDEPLTTRNEEGQMRHWQLSAKPRFDGEGTFLGYRGIALDVTAIQTQTQAVVRAEGDAKKAYKSKAQFLALMSLELRTPVNAIVGFSEVLNSGMAEALPAALKRDYTATILNSGRQLQTLLNDVLEASRLERGLLKLEEKTDDFTSVIQDVIKEATARAAQNRVSIVAKIYEDVEVRGDHARLRNLVLGLLNNAINYAPQDTVVQLEMQRGPDGALGLIVRDRGAGIPADEVPLALEPFALTDAATMRRMGGLGLGLAIARRVARLHGGDVILSNTAESGTEARFGLPASRLTWHPVNGEFKVMNIAA